MIEYKHQCPKCGIDLFTKDKYHHAEAIRNKRCCKRCGQLGKVLSKETRQRISDNNGFKGKPSNNRGLPYQWLLTRVIGQANRRGIGVELSYEQFLSFMNRPCDYCNVPITQSPYHHSKTKNFGWSLDRKNNDGPYSVDNITTACFRCNRIKGREFSYEQMKQIGNIIRTLNNG